VIQQTVKNQDELARYLGVTRLTVHRALNGQPGVGQAKRQKIVQAARDLGYRPNAAARATVTGRFNAAALVLSTQSGRSTLFPGLVAGAADALAAHDMHLSIARLPDEKLTDEGYMPRVLREWTVDGLLINYNQEIPDRLVELVQRHRIPSIWINSKQPADCVYPDDFGGGLQATERLLALGHRRIAFLSFSRPQHYSGADRLGGYEQAMRAMGLTPLPVLRPARGNKLDATGDDLRPLTSEVLQGSERPTAVLTNGVREAVALMHAAAWLHLEVPRDLSIASFAESVEDDAVVPLSKMRITRTDLGRLAVKMLLEKWSCGLCRGRASPPCSRCLSRRGAVARCPVPAGAGRRT
jgi:DNA-binding LacI/PurR family transcriptional regulator